MKFNYDQLGCIFAFAALAVAGLVITALAVVFMVGGR